jgi:hypothetical protein
VYDVAELLADPDPQAYQGQVTQLLALIRSNVDPRSWQANGGPMSVEQFNGLLVVTQTPENVQRIELLLEQLKATKAQQPPTPRQQAARTGAAIKMVGEMKDTAFEPSVVGLIAVAGLRDDVARDPKAVIDDLEALLIKTNSRGLRTAIRLTLRDLYKQTGNQEKLLQHLRAMLAENDQAISHAPPTADRVPPTPPAGGPIAPTTKPAGKQGG